MTKTPALVATAVVTATMVLAVGCASIVNCGTQHVRVRSEPTKASVSVYDHDGRVAASGTTPCAFALDRGAGFFTPAKYRVVIEKSGFATREIHLRGSINGWYIVGNLLVGPIGWIIVDPATGAMWSLSPQEIKVELTSQQGRSLGPQDGLNVVVLSEVPVECRPLMKSVATEM